MSDAPDEPLEHYFSAEPSGAFESREIAVELGGTEYRVETAGGVFSPEHIDAGTAALLRFVDAAPPNGNLLDLGCGWGPLALTMALESPTARVFAIDINQRSLELTRRNAERLGCPNIVASTPDKMDPAVRFDAIWTNPPIRIGKEALHAIMRQWLPRLNPGGQAWIVIAKHLGADSFEKWLATEFVKSHRIERVDTYKGFRVLRAVAVG